MRFTTTIATASVAAVLGLAGVSVAGATSNSGASKPATATAAVAPTTAPNAAPKAGTGAKHAAGKGAALRKRIRKGAGGVIAKTIGIPRKDLRQGLAAGKTIATIAGEHSVQPQAVIDALKTAANTKIDAAVTAGKIKAARAAKLKTRLETAIPKLVNEWHPRHATAG